MENEDCLSIVVVSPAVPTPEATAVEVAPEASPPKRGRPREYPTDEAREEGYKKRHKRHREKVKAETPPDADCNDPNAWKKYLRSIGLGMAEGKRMTDSRGSEGVLVTGGHDAQKIASLDSDHEIKERGKRTATTNYDQSGDEN